MNLCKYYDSTSALFISSILNYVINVRVGGPGYEIFFITIPPSRYPAMDMKATRQRFYIDVWKPSFQPFPWVIFSTSSEGLAVMLV